MSLQDFHNFNAESKHAACLAFLLVNNCYAGSAGRPLIYINAFVRHFNPKQLTVHLKYTIY